MSFAPAFTRDANSLDRFRQLRAFIERWYDVTIPPAGRVPGDVREVSEQIGRSLGIAVTEWMVLTADLQNAGRAAGMLRDHRRITALPEYASLSLNLQGEGDVHWAVPYTAIGEDDPLVQVWFLEEGEGSPFVLVDWSPPERVSLFAVTYLLSYCSGHDGFGGRVEDVPALVAKLRGAQISCVDLGGAWVWEGEGWFGVVTEMWSECSFRVMRKTPTATLPPEIAALAASAGWTQRR